MSDGNSSVTSSNGCTTRYSERVIDRGDLIRNRSEWRSSCSAGTTHRGTCVMHASAVARGDKLFLIPTTFGAADRNEPESGSNICVTRHDNTVMHGNRCLMRSNEGISHHNTFESHHNIFETHHNTFDAQQVHHHRHARRSV